MKLAKEKFLSREWQTARAHLRPCCNKLNRCTALPKNRWYDDLIPHIVSNMDKFDLRLHSAAIAVRMESFRRQFHMLKLQHNINELMIGGTISLTIPKVKTMEEGLVSPHWLVTTRITLSFPFSKTNLANIHYMTLCWLFVMNRPFNTTRYKI